VNCNIRVPRPLLHVPPLLGSGSLCYMNYMISLFLQLNRLSNVEWMPMLNWVIKLRATRRVEHVARTETLRNYTKFWSSNLKRGGHVGDLGINGSIILKRNIQQSVDCVGLIPDFIKAGYLLTGSVTTILSIRSSTMQSAWWENSRKVETPHSE
jgi:hypothetical protein